MVFEGEIVGRYVTLRSATVDDAEFTLAIRQNKRMTRYMPYLDITLEQQIAWIKKQRETEGDYFFVAWNRNNERFGTIGVYDIKDECAEVGRLAMLGTPFESIESQFLNLKFAYEILGLKKIYGHILTTNKSSLRLSNYLGGILSDRNIKLERTVVDFKGHPAYKIEGTREIFAQNKDRILELLSHEEWA